MLIWKFKTDGTPVLQEEETLPPNTVTIKDKDGKTNPIKRIAETTGRKMLGVRKAGNLQEKTELEHLIQKTQKFTCAIIACPVQPHEV